MKATMDNLGKSNTTIVRHGRRLLVAMALVAATAAGCATSGEPVPADEKAVDSASEATGSARSAARQAAEQSGPFEVDARLNPPDCDAPIVEIHAHGRWERAWLRPAGGDEIRRVIQRLRSRDPPVNTAHETFRLRGDYTGKRRAETGRTYRVFTVRAVISKFD